MPTFADVKRAARHLPEVTESTWYGTRALAVRGKAFCRLWSDREHARNGVDDTAVLVVLCDRFEKDALIAASGGVLFTTPHYDGRGAVLVRLADVDRDGLVEYLETGYRIKAPAQLRRQLDDRAR